MLNSNTIITLALASIAAVAQAETTNPWATYPKVPKTATYNGFADPIYDVIPDCAKECVKASTDSTPCPYWDTGCLCVMSNWGSPVAECVAKNCQGNDVGVYTSAASSKCSVVGVPSPYLFINDEAIEALSSAAAAAETTSSSPTTTEAKSSSAKTTAAEETGETEEAKAKSSVAETTAAETTAAETTAAEENTEAKSSDAKITAAPTSSAETSQAKSSASVASDAAAESSASEGTSAASSSSSDSKASQSASVSVSVAAQTNGAIVKGASFAAGFAAVIALI